MKIKNPAKNWRPRQTELDEGDAQFIKRLAAHIHNRAVPGVPYVIPTLLDEAGNANGSRLSLSTVPGLLQALVVDRRWRQVGRWGVFLRSQADVPLRSILDGSIVNSIPYTVTQISDWVKELTGQDISGGNLRKTLGRLVDQGRFSRTENGIYQRIYRGM